MSVGLRPAADNNTKVLVMAGFHRLDLRLPLVPQVPGQKGGPVLAALAAPDEEETLAEIDILDAQAETLQQAQTAAIEQPRHEGMPARHGGEPPLNLRLGEHGGRPLVALTADRGDLSDQGLVKDIPIEKNQGVQGLPLGGGRHLALRCGVGEKPFHLLCPKPVRMGLAAEVMDRAQYPLAIGLLGTVGVVMLAEPLAHLVHELEAGLWATFRCIFLLTFHALWHSSAISGNPQEKISSADSHRANDPPFTMNIAISGNSVHP
jgi:hypothetical protein